MFFNKERKTSPFEIYSLLVLGYIWIRQALGYYLFQKCSQYALQKICLLKISGNTSINLLQALHKVTLSLRDSKLLVSKHGSFLMIFLNKPHLHNPQPQVASLINKPFLFTQMYSLSACQLMKIYVGLSRNVSIFETVYFCYLHNVFKLLFNEICFWMKYFQNIRVTLKIL